MDNRKPASITKSRPIKNSDHSFFEPKEEKLDSSSRTSTEVDLIEKHVLAKQITSEEAIAYAKKVGPRLYDLENHDSDTVRFFVFGCQGELGAAQKKVAALINNIIAEDPSKKPDFLIILGDNIYPSGVYSPDDLNFQAQFHSVYGNPNLIHICNIPCLVILGNHDARLDKFSLLLDQPSKIWHSAKGYFSSAKNETVVNASEEAELLEVAHTYMTQPGDPISNKSKFEIYQGNKLNLKAMQRWNMPYFYTSYKVGNVRFFCLNSNTYVRDFLELLIKNHRGEYVDTERNQAAWLKLNYNVAVEAGETIFFIQHHPLETICKRILPHKWDAYLYAAPEQIQLILAILELSPDSNDYPELLDEILSGNNAKVATMPTNGNHSVMLKTIINKFQRMYPHAVLNAHDHASYLFNDISTVGPGNNLCEVVVGTGGSTEIMGRLYFGGAKNLAYFFNMHGVVMIHCNKRNPNIINIEPYTVKGHHLVFNNLSNQPIFETHMEPNVKILREQVLKACEMYQTFLHVKQHEFDGNFFGRQMSHLTSDVDCMHEIINYLNQPHPQDFANTIAALTNLTKKIANKTSKHNLYRFINDQVVAIAAFGRKNLDELNLQHNNVIEQQTSIYSSLYNHFRSS